MKFSERLSGAIMLRTGAYDDVNMDPSASKQSAIVVMLSACAIALGTHGRESPITIAVAIAAGILGWVLWSWVAHAVGTTLLRTSGTAPDWGRMLRTTGFATAPGLLAAVGMLRPLAGVAVFVSAVWMLTAFVVAVKQTLNYTSTTRAALVYSVAWGVNVLLLMIAFTPGGA